MSLQCFRLRLYSSLTLKWSHLIFFILMLRLDAFGCRQQQQQPHQQLQQHRLEDEIGNSRVHGEVYEYQDGGRHSYSGEQHNGGRTGNGHGHGHGHRNGHRKKHNGNHMEDNGLSLWISEQQLKMLSAMFFPQANPQGRLYAIENGQVLNYIRDISMFTYLNIPSEVNYVNFTWKSGSRKYSYNFDRLQTLDETILKAPTVSIKTKGRIPREEKNFSVFLPCNGNKSGIAMFSVGLSIYHRRGKPLAGTPLRMNFKKECAHRGVYDSLDASNPTTLTSAQGPDPECTLKCVNNGSCNHNKICQCDAGYTGEYCQTAICFPHCLNGGNCTAPSVCTCPPGYQGTSCEGGICDKKCLNGGKCIQKNKCQCSNGYYGLHCEFSKCVIPCKNDGRCIGPNKCRCPNGLGGNHCEVGRKQRSTCKRPCKHGICTHKKTCKCNPGFSGRFCNKRIRKHRRDQR